MLLAILLVSGVAAVCLPGVLAGVARRLEPGEWAGICRISLVAGTVAIEVALAAQAAPTVLRAFGVTRLAEACERMVGAWVPGGAVIGWAAAGAAVAVPALAVLGVVRTRRTWSQVHIEAGLGRRDRFGGFDVVVLSTSLPVAYGVRHGRRDQIVVSEGLLARLDESQARAALAHEAAHLRLRHDRFLLVGAAVEHALMRVPPVRASVQAMRAGLEHWADDASTGTDPARRLQLRGALLQAAQVIAVDAVTALSGGSIVADRIAALGAGPTRSSLARRIATYLPLVAVALAGAAALGSWLGELPAVVSMATCTWA